MAETMEEFRMFRRDLRREMRDYHCRVIYGVPWVDLPFWMAWEAAHGLAAIAAGEDPKPFLDRAVRKAATLNALSDEALDGVA